MIKAMNEVQALHDITSKRRRSIEEKLLIVLIVVVLFAIGAIVAAMVYPDAITASASQIPL